MRISQGSVPKMTPEGGMYDSELRFCGAEEALREMLSRSSGKTLLISDGGFYRVFAPIGHPHTIFAVLDREDVLPLFSMPDGVSGIAAVGGEFTMRAARYFAEVRGIRCLLFPVEPALDSVFEMNGEMTVGGVASRVPLAEAELCCDLQILRPALSRGYARLLLSQLERSEERALCMLERREVGALYEEGYAAARCEISAEAIIRANASLRRLEAQGLAVGEATAFMRILAKEGIPEPEWQAYRALTALYSAFFERGKPRRYFVPDYTARTRRAKADYGAQNIPSPAENAARAMRLERMRAELVREFLPHSRNLNARRHTVCTLLGSVLRDEDVKKQLKTLPERAQGGLSSVIRDFGLMEF